MNEEAKSLIKIINHIFRYTQFYTDNVLKKYNLSSGLYPYLLILNHNEGISQNTLSKELCVDKAMSARTIKKLMELGYVRKESDSEDSRAYKLYLTQSAKDIIPEIKNNINEWIEFITRDSSDYELKIATGVLNKAEKIAKKYKESNGER